MNDLHLPCIENVAGSTEYADARRRVWVQLIEALLYENLVSFTMTESDGGKGEIHITGREADGAEVRYACTGGRSASFGRIRLEGAPILRMQAGRTEEAMDPAVFLADMARAQGRAPAELAEFARELEQTLLNDADARYWRRGRLAEHAVDRRPSFSDASRAEGDDGDQVCQVRHPSRSCDDLEGDVLEAHPYHPCYKSRIGFDRADNAAYGPEFHPRLRLQWLAVRREDVEVTAADGAGGADWRAILREELGEPAFAGYEARLRGGGRDPADYVLVPMHPWQWRESAATLYFRELARGRMVALGEGSDWYAPQQSIRALANRSAPERLTVKLALGIRNTSALRTISPRHARNGPRMSARLAAILRGDDALRTRWRPILLAERLGMAYRSERLPAPVRAAGEGALGAIWRESVSSRLEAGEEAVPYTVLCHIGADGRPYIDAWVRAEGVAPWLTRLLDVTLQPLLHLLYAHGVAIEAHAQNLLLVHRRGVPERLAAKDFSGGVLFYAGEGADPQRLPETGSYSDVRDVLHNALFFVNLAELARLLDVHYGWPEARFWAYAAAAIRRYEGEYPGRRDVYAACDLFAETVEVGRLAARRMLGEGTARDQRVSNPLYAHRHTGSEGRG
ncbi:siderophore biosynthesis protein [Paenibacillus sp. IB182496]|uniref:Siderophore biosynthesis protein n=1 Tax=Paenibacillus sabuli TaxID=2772509 RepID=A0A927GUA8_9BACL|nr:IucA/IucC family protein [Paenibacillus sabuli]MBD2848478.1 siderophore biosynthesis protein [Paenibacillus sabuli]